MYRRLETALLPKELDMVSGLMGDRPLESDYESKQQFAEFCLAVSQLPIKC